MNKYSKLLLTIFCCSLAVVCYSQQRNCGAWNPSEQQRISKEHQELYLQKKLAFKKRMRSSSRISGVCSSPTQLPIAIHYQGILNPDSTCLIALAEDQVNILNNDLIGNNSDTILWVSDAASFPGISNGKTCIEFVMANQNHPIGYGLNNGDVAVTINTTTGDYLPDWAGYINIVVRDISDLGYAPLGGVGNGDAINVDDNAFGTFGCGQVIPQAPYHLGRTLVHELGHYLYLNHIWANSSDAGGCANDDGIADTPVSDGPHYGCPSLSTSCSSNDLHMNFMDYVNDACMYMFTEGQAQVMENWVATALQPLVNNVSTVYQAPICTNCTPPGCTDVDQDGYCASDDCDDTNSAIPAATGTPCNDNNATTYNDIIQLDGCTCAGIVNTCIQKGGDTDGDGICDDEDCQPLDACYPKPIGTSCDDGISLTSNDQIQSDGCTCSGMTSLQARVFLEGFYNAGTQTMLTALNSQNLLPLIQPYNQPPWNYAGTEQVTTIPTNAVDWILVMARDAADNILAQSVGFVDNQGQLISLDGSNGIVLSQAYGNYISIHHRNHLAIISENTYGAFTDFTISDTTVKGTQQLKNVAGKYCLYAGDFDGSGIVNNQDYNQWAIKKSALNQYLPIDADGNGIINNLDYNLWLGNGAKIGHNGIHY